MNENARSRPVLNAHGGTEILATHTPELFHKAVRRAAELLRAGQTVALPTETVYGLAANALDDEAVARVFQIKGRTPRNPVIVHVGSLRMAKSCAAKFPAPAERLATAFWPGPLTLILKRAGTISETVTAGGDTVGLRWPAHPFIQAVIDECNFPLAVPSANLSGQTSPTNVEHVLRQLGGTIPAIADGGQCQVGIESTVLDLTARPPRILRPGMIHRQSLSAVCGKVAEGAVHRANNEPLRSPGLLHRHYAPKARLLVFEWRNEAALQARLARSRISRIGCHVIAHTRIPRAEGFADVCVIPHDAEAFARAIYSELHRCDAAGARTIIVEAPPEGPEWQGIADRLRRAAA